MESLNLVKANLIISNDAAVGINQNDAQLRARVFGKFLECMRDHETGQAGCEENRRSASSCYEHDHGKGGIKPSCKKFHEIYFPLSDDPPSDYSSEGTIHENERQETICLL